jgi:hypothetical protein
VGLRRRIDRMRHPVLDAMRDIDRFDDKDAVVGPKQE